MAIDTAEKRKSIRGIGGRRVAPGVTPNSGQDQEWRQEAGRSYSGILAAALAVAAPAAPVRVASGLTIAAERGELRRILGGVPFATKTADYAALSTDEVIECDATASAITITLPPVAGSPGVAIRIKKTDSSANAVTVDANGSELIDGATTAVLMSQFESILVVCNGVNWGIH